MKCDVEQNEVPTITQGIQKNEGYINLGKPAGLRSLLKTLPYRSALLNSIFQLYCYVSHLLNMFSYTTSTPVTPASQQNLSP